MLVSAISFFLCLFSLKTQYIHFTVMEDTDGRRHSRQKLIH